MRYLVTAFWAAQALAIPQFEKDVRPILEKHCAGCHQGAAAQASLDIRTFSALRKGGTSGPAITPGKSSESLLYKRVAAGQMPPGGALPKAAVEILREWIDGGAPAADPRASAQALDRQHWAFQPPRRPATPRVREANRVRTPIDAFVLAQLEKRGLALSPEAEPAALLRRVTYDLTGLPSTPRQLDDFLANPSYEAYVDRLLASPRYGERWARHWLDAAGYADSEGVLAADVVRDNAWRYRDYVIRAFNSNKGYDQFVREQLAGAEISEYYRHDGLPREAAESLAATGFLRTAVDATREDFLPKDFAEYNWRTLFDTEQIAVSSLMGITIQCARCHDHKYEPLTQRDYYGVQAIFAGALRPTGKVLPSYKRLIVDAPEAERARAQKVNGPLDGIAKALRDLQASRRAHYRNQHPHGEKATEEELRQAFPEYAKKADETAAEFKDAEAKKITLATIRALYDQDAQPPATHILQRGDPLKPGEPVEPSVPAVLAHDDRPFQVPTPGKDAKTTGRRLAFAQWLTQPQHPLTARVFVNRVWAAYFGTGIVPTLDNFGKSGTAPTHPELLDWLATEFVAQGWDIKWLHRTIVMSSVYRQASMARPEGLAKDPENEWLWRMTPRRLEAEAVRDAVLAAAGTLDATMFGAPVAAETKKSGEVAVKGEADAGRRSIYQIVRRSAPQHFLAAFDAPSMEINCIRRPRSTSATQALALMNGDFITAQAKHFAARVGREAEPAGQVRHAFRLAMGRQPSGDEADLLESFLERQRRQYDEPTKALADLCQVLLGANEFIYLD